MSQHNEPSSELPAGEADAVSSVASDVVFLVTDIEDSSSLWEADRIGMGANVAAHDQILTSRIAAGGGEVFKHTGDGMLSVFPSIDSAVTAAGEIQRDLAAHGWSSPGPVRVRMAIDIGPAQERSGDYFGPGMNRVMRRRFVPAAQARRGRGVSSGVRSDDHRIRGTRAARCR